MVTEIQNDYHSAILSRINLKIKSILSVTVVRNLIRFRQNPCIIRPPDIVCRRTYILPVFLSSVFFFFAAWSPRSLNGTERKSATWSEVNVIYKRTSEIWDTPSPYKSGAQKPPFWTTSQLDGNFNGLYLRNETRYRQSVKCVDNYKVCPTLSENVMNFGPQTASNSTCIFTHPM